LDSLLIRDGVRIARGKREHTRVATSRPAWVRETSIPSTPQRCSVVNFSRGGLLLRSETPVPVGSEVTVEINRKRWDEPNHLITSRGVTVWQSQTKTGEYDVGIELILRGAALPGSAARDISVPSTKELLDELQRSIDQYLKLRSENQAVDGDDVHSFAHIELAREDEAERKSGTTAGSNSMSRRRRHRAAALLLLLLLLLAPVVLFTGRESILHGSGGERLQEMLSRIPQDGFLIRISDRQSESPDPPEFIVAPPLEASRNSADLGPASAAGSGRWTGTARVDGDRDLVAGSQEAVDNSLFLPAVAAGMNGSGAVMSSGNRHPGAFRAGALSGGSAPPPAGHGAGTALEIVVDRSQFRLSLLRNGIPVRTYPVGLGRDDTTPVGEFRIATKLVNPAWRRPDGVIIQPGSPENELGSRWLGLARADGTITRYGIHATNDLSSIGSNRSAGCIRMNQADVEELFRLVRHNLPVRMVE